MITMSENNTPEMWNWGIGAKSDSYYDKWLHHKDYEYEIHVWWDEGNSHNVELISINGYDEHGDPVRNVEVIRQFDTENEAIEYACDLMEEYV